MVQKGEAWQLVEMTKPIDSMEDQEGEIEELKFKGQFMAKIVTFVTPATAGQAPEDLGFEVEGFDYKASKKMRADVQDYAIPVAEDKEEMEGREIVAPDPPGGASLDDQAVRLEVGVAIPERIQVNGVELTLESPLRTLRAACAFYQIGQSGGKRKRFSRLVEHQTQLELLQARDLANQALASQGRTSGCQGAK